MPERLLFVWPAYRTACWRIVNTETIKSRTELSQAVHTLRSRHYSTAQAQEKRIYFFLVFAGGFQGTYSRPFQGEVQVMITN